MGALAYVFVLSFVGWPTLDLTWESLGVELMLALQYIVIGIGFALLIALAAGTLLGLRGRDLTIGRLVAACAGAFAFGACFLPAEVLWILNHRPFAPTSSGFLAASAVIFLLATITGGIGYTIVRWAAEALHRRSALRALIPLFCVAVAAGCASSRLLLGPKSTGPPLQGEVSAGVRLEGGGLEAGRSNTGRVVIIGLDGATWRLLEPMIERDELPNLEWLIRHGTSGPLTSFEPIESPRIWTSIATGKTPEKHGIQEFLVDRRFIRTSTLWEIAEDAGKRVGLYDWLVTYPPPREQNGFVIPGWLAGGRSTTHPEHLGRTLFLARALRYPFWFMKTALYRLPAGYLEEARGNNLPRRINSQFVKAEFKELDLPYLQATQDPELLAVVFYGTDVLAHTLWQYMEPEHFSEVDPEATRRYGDVLPAYYRKVDGAIGRIRRLSDEQTTLLVVSDHGFRPARETKEIVNINADRLLRDLELSDAAHAVGGGTDYALIGLNGTPASPAGTLGRPDRNHLRQEVLDDLNGIRSVSTGEQVFSAARGDEKEGDIRLSLNPSLDLALPHRIRVGDRLSPLEGFLRRVVLSGDHDPRGVFIIKGPGIREGARISGASVLDITPTVLYAMGLPVGSDMDGKVLTGAFTQAQLRSSSIRFVDSYDSNRFAQDPPVRPDVDAEVMERLQSLGYLN